MSGYSLEMKIEDGRLCVDLIGDDDQGGWVEASASVPLKELAEAIREAAPLDAMGENG